MRKRIAYALLTASAVVAALGIAAPGPRRVNIRWAPSATLAARVAAEQELGVRAVMSREERTWSYEVPDAGLIPKIIQHPLVEDTHHLDRAEATFSPELPPARAAVRGLYEGGPLGRSLRAPPGPVEPRRFHPQIREFVRAWNFSRACLARRR